jgi:hypothetical protein
LLLLIALPVAGATGYGITRVYDYAAVRGALAGLLSEVEGGAHRQSALEWQATAEGRLSSELAREHRQVDDSMHDLLDLLLAEDPDSMAARTVADAFAVYSAAVDGQFELLRAGRVAEAEEVDEQQVDPAFDGLAEALTAAAAYYAAVAQEANQRADLGTVVLLLAAASVIGVLVWRFQRVRAQAAQVLAHQAPRCADSAAQPCPAAGAAGARAGPLRATQNAGVPAVAGPGRFQGGQRQPRTPGRRPTALGGRGATTRLPAAW